MEHQLAVGRTSCDTPFGHVTKKRERGGSSSGSFLFWGFFVLFVSRILARVSCPVLWLGETLLTTGILPSSIRVRRAKRHRTKATRFPKTKPTRRVVVI